MHEGQKIGSAVRDGDLEDPGIRKVERARIRETIGAGLGISGASYQRARRLVVAAETGDTTAVAAVERMDRSGKITPAPCSPYGAAGPTARSSPVPAVTAALSAPHRCIVGRTPGEGASENLGPAPRVTPPSPAHTYADFPRGGPS